MKRHLVVGEIDIRAKAPEDEARVQDEPRLVEVVDQRVEEGTRHDDERHAEGGGGKCGDRGRLRGLRARGHVPKSTPAVRMPRPRAA